MRVLFEDNHLLAVAKPAGIATMGAAPGEETLLDHAKAYLKEKYNKPGEVYLGIVSRLDAPVSGVILFARTSKAASRLTEAYKTRKVEKRYLAIVEGQAPPCLDTIVHHLKKDDAQHKMFATQMTSKATQQAEMQYQVLVTHEERSLLQVRLLTGRKHQIRVQLAKLGHPVLGDKLYGSEQNWGNKASGEKLIALHSWKLQLDHPVRHEPVRLVCPPPKTWPINLPPEKLPHPRTDGSDMR